MTPADKLTISRMVREALAEHDKALAANPAPAACCPCCKGSGEGPIVSFGGGPEGVGETQIPCPACDGSGEHPAPAADHADDRMASMIEHGMAGLDFSKPPQPAPAPVQPSDTDIEDAAGWVAANCDDPDIEETILLALADRTAQPPAPGEARLPPLPQAFFDEFGKGADDRVQDYARVAIAALRQPVPDAVRELPGKWRAEAETVRHDPEAFLDKKLEGYTETLDECADELESTLIASQQESRND